MPAVDLRVETGNSVDEALKFYNALLKGTSVINDLTTSFVKVNSASGRTIVQIQGVTAAGEKMTTVLQRAGGATTFVSTKLESGAKAAAAAAKALAAAARPGEAARARAPLEAKLGAGLPADIVNSVQSRIGQITSAIDKGRASFTNFQNALSASMGQFSGTLTETEQKILNVIRRIDTSITKSRDKMAVEAAKKAALAASQVDAGRIIPRLLADVQQRGLIKLDVSAQARIKSQIDKIQNLFDKGLTQAGWNKALDAIRNGTVVGLDRIEREARHRMTRINAELDRVPRGGLRGFLFGGMKGEGPPPGGGKGLLGAFGGAQALGGLVLINSLNRVKDATTEAIDEAVVYQKQIALLRTLSQDTADTFDDWSNAILEVANATGVSRSQIAKAGYDLLSNQITKGAADTKAALQDTAKFSIVTASTVGDSTNLLSSVINSFGYNVGDTERILAKLFTAIDLGRIKAEDMANTFGRPAVAARSLGVTFDELLASEITISQTGLGVEQTNTLITNVFHKLLNPTKELQAIYDKLGDSTGEMFVKTHGFAGALEILTKETGGSSAEIAKLFNEIRGEQGFTQLSTRLNVFLDALKKLKSPEAAKGAIKIFDDLAAQRFTKEMEKINNFLLGIKKKGLDILDFTNNVVGLSKAFEYLAVAAIAAGVAIAAAFVAANTALLGTPAILAAVTAAASIPLYALYKQHTDIRDAAKNNEAMSQEMSGRLTKEADRVNKELLEKDTDRLAKMRQNALQYVSTVVAALSNVAKKQKEVFEAVGERLKDSFELVAQALKRVVADVEAKESAAQENITKTIDRRRDAIQKYRDNIYEQQLKRNELNVQFGYPDRENVIQIQRINQLRKEAYQYSISGDPKDAEKALSSMEKAQDIAQGISLQTRTVDGEQILKYTDGLNLVTTLYKEHQQLLSNIKETNESILETTRKEAEERRRQLKELQGAGEALLKFKLFDETGKFIHGTPEKAREKLSQLEKAYTDSIINAVPPGELLAHGKTLKEFMAQTRADLGKFSGSVNDQLITFESTTKAEGARAATAKKYENLEEERKALSAQQQSAYSDYIKRTRSAAGMFQTFRDIKDFSLLDKATINLGGRGAGPGLGEVGRRIPEPVGKLLESAQGALNIQNTKKSIEQLDAAIKLLREMGISSDKVLDQTGKSTTLEGLINSLKQEITYQDKARALYAMTTLQVDEVNRKSQEFSSELRRNMGVFKELEQAAKDFSDGTGKAFLAVNSQAQTVINAFDILLLKMDSLLGKANAIKESYEEMIKATPMPGAPMGGSGIMIGPPKPPTEYFGGALHRASGGGIRGSDKIPFIGAPGEIVMNQQASDRFKPQLIAMNAGFEPSFYNRPDSPNQYSIGDVHIHVKGTGSTKQDAREMATEFRRQIRRGAMSL